MFKKSEGLAPSGDIVVDADAHERVDLWVCPSVPRSWLGHASSSTPPSQPASPSATTTAATVAARPGVVSLLQTTTRAGKRSSTYHAFLEGDAERRPNLRIVTDAQVTRLVLDDAETPTATGIEYRHHGATVALTATKEVIVCAGAIGSPHLLMLSGIGAAATNSKQPAFHACSTPPASANTSKTTCTRR